jgi:hypothetical protein
MAWEGLRRRVTVVPWHKAMRLIGSCALPLIVACSGTSGASGGPGIAASASGTLVVSWSAPAKNTDGTPLTDLAGYTIYYGTQPAAQTKSLTIDDPSATHAVIQGLQPGVHYFVTVASNNSTGRHSAPASAGQAGASSK